MLKQRLITSIILVSCLLSLLFLAPPAVIYGIFFVVLLIAAYEWVNIIPITEQLNAWLFVGLYMLCLLATYYFHPVWFICFIGVWLPIIAFILLYPKATLLWAHYVVIMLLSLVVTCLFAYAAQSIFMFEQGKFLLVYILSLVWAADIGAYTFGKLWGKHKLIPRVSPGKSWEGFVGGLIFVAVVVCFGGWYFAVTDLLNWYFLSLSCFIISIFGDLFISMLKRNCNIKDTGQILPGHGGILDRLDSLMSAVPLFYVGLGWLSLGIQ